MYKIIDLGADVPGTGEQRVRLLRDDLVKTASTEIQDYWDSIERDGVSAHLWVIGVSAREYYGCNNNGDAFDEADLRRAHPDFVTNAHVFLHHVNKDPARSIGKPVFSWYNEDMHRVELILRIDKANPAAAETVRKIREGEQIYVSMGTTVAFDVCSICGNRAKTRREYCDHLRYNMRKILPDGRQVYALNPNPKFFDISIVAKPADPTAFALDKAASEGAVVTDMHAPVSAELGERFEDAAAKLAALRKVSDIVKRVEGRVVDSAGAEDAPEEEGSLSAAENASVDAVANIARNGFAEFGYPEMPYERLSGMGVSPAGFILSMAGLGAPVTLGDAAWLAGGHVYGRCPDRAEFGEMFSCLPRALRALRDNPDWLDGIVRNVCSTYFGECDAPAGHMLILRVIRPVAAARVRIVSAVSPGDLLQKFGSALGFPNPEERETHFGTNPVSRMLNSLNPRKENFATILLKDGDGNVAATTPYHMRQASAGRSIPMAAALAAGAIGAMLMSPVTLRRVLMSAAVGIPGAALLSRFFNPVTTSEGGRLSQEEAASVWKRPVKTASSAQDFWALAGMAVPAAAALDYAYNRWKLSTSH